MLWPSLRWLKPTLLLVIGILHRKHFLLAPFGQKEGVQYKLTAVVLAVTPRDLCAFITAANFSGSPLRTVCFPQSNCSFGQLLSLCKAQCFPCCWCLHYARVPCILGTLCAHSWPPLTPGLPCQSFCQAPSVSPQRKAVELCTCTYFEYLKPFCYFSRYYGTT